MTNTLPPHENQTTSLRSSPSFSYEENILKDNILIGGGLTVLLFLRHSFEKGNIDFIELKLLMRLLFFLAIVYFDFRHLHITQNTKITANFLAIIIQKIAFYVLLGMAVFSPDLEMQIFCAIGVLISKSIHIVPTGKRAIVSRNGKHIATKTGIFIMIPFLDTAKWEKDPNQEKPKTLSPQYSQKTSKTLPYTDQPLFRSPFEMFFIAFDSNTIEIQYTLELHTKNSLSYHQKGQYEKMLHTIILTYTANRQADFLLSPEKRSLIEETICKNFQNRIVSQNYYTPLSDTTESIDQTIQIKNISLSHSLNIPS